MLVVMHSHATEEQIRAVCERIESLGYKALPVPGAGRTAVCITGNKSVVDVGSGASWGVTVSRRRLSASLRRAGSTSRRGTR